MPWRGAEEPGEYPTLGHLVGEYIEAKCVIPDREVRGNPFLLTGEMWRFLFEYYRLDPETGRFVYRRGGQLVRPQKWGKGPFSAAIACAEAAGPVLPDGWDAAGEPVGRPWATPLIQITAGSEDQTDNVWDALVPMIELGDLGADIPDTGETRINLPGGGEMVPVTSSPRSRLGQRITWALQDQTESWTSHNGGRKLADNQRRGLAGMGGRFLETPNAWDPAEHSVAQQTNELAVKQAAEGATEVYIDDVDAGPGSIRNRRDRAKLLRRAYGDSAREAGGWVDLERIEVEIVDLLPRDAAQAERWFVNRKLVGEDAAFDPEKWKKCFARDHKVEDGTLIVIGVDGARYDDALAIVATEVASGFQWPLHIFERPADKPDDYEHDQVLVDGVIAEAFDRFDVWRAYCDPQYIEGLVDRWRGRWGEKRVIEWLTNRPRQIAHAVRAYTVAMGAGDVSHNGDETLALHIENARRKRLNVYDDERRPMHTLTKPAPSMKIDGAMAAVLSWEARGDAIAAGAGPRKAKRAAGF